MDKHRGADERLLYRWTETDEQMDGQIHIETRTVKQMKRGIDFYRVGHEQTNKWMDRYTDRH